MTEVGVTLFSCAAYFRVARCALQAREPGVSTVSLDEPSKFPLVSIGIPIYNEEKYIEKTLSSLCSQDYPNIEFIVSDNASTDGSWKCCEEMASVDRRIRLLRVSENKGATANFQRCLDAANGTFFMWAGGHDLWSREFVSECVSVFNQYPEAVIAVPESCWVDPAGVPFGQRASMLDTRGMAPLSRVFSLLWANMHPMYGLMRTAALRATGPVPNYPGADLVLLMYMILQGDFVPARNALWSRREKRMGETFEERQRRYKSIEMGMQDRGFSNLLYQIVKAVWISQLHLADKAAFTVAFLAQLPARYLVARRRVS